MPSYRGKFQYLAPGGAVSQQGACQIQFDEETFTLALESGPSLVFDLGDIDSLISSDYEIRLLLYTGNTVLLQQFGKAFQDLSRELLENYRKRALQCLLLEDLEEVDRFAGVFALETAGVASASGPAEIRLFKSNLAVLPTASQAFQWRLVDITDLRFDAQNYEIVLERDGDRLRLNRLAKRTELLHNKLRDALDALHTECGQALHRILPFLNPAQLQAALGLVSEGHSASLTKLAAVHPRIPDALAKNAVDDALKPYYDELLRRSPKDQVFAGYKLIRAEENAGVETRLAASPAASGSEDDGADVYAISARAGMPDADSSVPDFLYWFFFPLTAKEAPQPNVVAWEASSRSGRATYFFRLSAPAVEQGVACITRVLGLLNFRRRPIYLSEDDLTGKPEFHRYAIAVRKIADLRTVRAAFLGRAIHSSFEAWRDQVDAILSKARE